MNVYHIKMLINFGMVLTPHNLFQIIYGTYEGLKSKNNH